MTSPRAQASLLSNLHIQYVILFLLARVPGGRVVSSGVDVWGGLQVMMQMWYS
jgi:hypothetical protein